MFPPPTSPHCLFVCCFLRSDSPLSLFIDFSLFVGVVGFHVGFPLPLPPCRCVSQLFHGFVRSLSLRPLTALADTPIPFVHLFICLLEGFIKSIVNVIVCSTGELQTVDSVNDSDVQITPYCRRQNMTRWVIQTKQLLASLQSQICTTTDHQFQHIDAVIDIYCMYSGMLSIYYNRGRKACSTLKAPYLQCKVVVKWYLTPILTLFVHQEQSQPNSEPPARAVVASIK